MTRKQPGSMPASAQGFTLLEVMVVVVIIAIIVSVAVFTIGDNSARKLSEEARRFQTLVRLAADESVLQGRDIGLKVEQNSYSFQIYDDQIRQWQSLQSESIFRTRHLPHGMTMELFLDDQLIEIPIAESDDDEEILTPQVLMLSSGEVTPFELVIELEAADQQIALKGSLNGVVETLDEN